MNGLDLVTIAGVGWLLLVLGAATMALASVGFEVELEKTELADAVEVTGIGSSAD